MGETSFHTREIPRSGSKAKDGKKEKKSWVCRATLDFNYRLGCGWVGLGTGWARVGVGLGSGWDRVGVGSGSGWGRFVVGLGLERKFGSQIAFQSRRSGGWVAGWVYGIDEK